MRPRGDIKGTWKVLNSALRKKTKSATINSLKIKGKDLSNPAEIANELNNYFCDTARRIQNEDPALKSNENTPSFDAFIRKIPKSSKNFRFKPILPSGCDESNTKTEKQQFWKHPHPLFKRCSTLCVYLFINYTFKIFGAR